MDGAGHLLQRRLVFKRQLEGVELVRLLVAVVGRPLELDQPDDAWIAEQHIPQGTVERRLLEQVHHPRQRLVRKPPPDHEPQAIEKIADQDVFVGVLHFVSLPVSLFIPLA